MSVRTILSWYLSFKMFEKISYSLIIKNLIKTAYFCDFFYIGAKIFIIAHHGFHHSVWQCLKYLGYEAYVYAHSPGRGPQLDSKKTRKPYFSRLYQKVDFVRLYSRLSFSLSKNTHSWYAGISWFHWMGTSVNGGAIYLVYHSDDFSFC